VRKQVPLDSHGCVWYRRAGFVKVRLVAQTCDESVYYCTLQNDSKPSHSMQAHERVSISMSKQHSPLLYATTLTNNLHYCCSDRRPLLPSITLQTRSRFNGSQRIFAGLLMIQHLLDYVLKHLYLTLYFHS
jgi:hypothetical protein